MKQPHPPPLALKDLYSSILDSDSSGTLKALLGEKDKKALIAWAADCAEHVLPFFEKGSSGDTRPREAVEAGRAWARGEIGVKEARAAAVAAHAAARSVGGCAAVAAARSAGHAVATAHSARHSVGAAIYTLKAVSCASEANQRDKAVDKEKRWQLRRLSRLAEHRQA